MDNYFHDTIALPYTETIGVGSNAKCVRKESKEEMLAFLRSEESLVAYSNSQELLAVATLFNININIFTYYGKEGFWSSVCPEPALASSAQLKGDWAPDLFLYHCRDIHYDLLVGDESRLAKMGLIVKDLKDNENWSTVVGNKLKNETSSEDNLLVEDERREFEFSKNLDELEEEITLLRGKNSGHKRVNPQTYAEKVKGAQFFKCSQCKQELESQGLLEAHMKIHTQAVQIFCKNCDETFNKTEDLQKHLQKEHEEHEEWNCNDCAFQSNGAAELMNHLKLTSHQPSPNITDRRKLFKDYKRCYTCNLEVDGYVTLMNHRKDVHPSRTKCKNFPHGCKWGVKCWYVHEEDLMDLDESFKNEDSPHKCYLCGEVFKTKDELRKHRKKEHKMQVQICEKNLNNICGRSDDQCWYIHNQEISNIKSKPENEKIPATTRETQVFHRVPQNSNPPENMQNMMEAIKNLGLKIERMDERLNQLMN